jgi:hypothetical protein
MLNKRDPKIAPVGIHKRGNNHNIQKKETVPLQAEVFPEGQSTREPQETTLLKNLVGDPLGNGVER